MARVSHPLPSLTLLLPDLVPALRLAMGPGALPSVAPLERLIGRGVLESVRPDEVGHLQIWQADLLRVLGLDARAAHHASAPLCWLGEESGESGGTWLQAEPVHLAAGPTRMQLQPAMLEPEEAQRLWPLVSEACAARGLKLHASASGAWFVQGTDAPDVETFSPQAAAERPLYEALPTGAWGPELRQLMTELQMLLYEHPVNQRRERQDRLPVNSLWLWGAGSVSDVDSRPLPLMFSDEPYVRGICRLYGSDWRPLPADAAAVLVERGEIVVVWRDAIGKLERWLAPLTQDLDRIGELSLVMGSSKVRVRSGVREALARLFRRRPALGDLLT